MREMSQGFQFISTKVRELEKQEIKKSGLGITDRELAYIVLINDAVSPKIDDIRKQAGVTKSTISNKIKILIEKGLVVLEQSKLDRRVKFATLTKKGKEAYSLHAVIRDKIQKKYYGEFTAEEIKTAVKLGRKLLDKIYSKS